jgi:hypothetical protein
MLRVDWEIVSKPPGILISSDWTIRNAPSRSVQLEFEALARRAGAALPSAKGDPLVAWFEALRAEGGLGSFMDFNVYHEVDSSGALVANHQHGKIINLAAVSADLCKVLENRALQAESKHLQQKVEIEPPFAPETSPSQRATILARIGAALGSAAIRAAQIQGEVEDHAALALIAGDLCEDLVTILEVQVKTTDHVALFSEIVNWAASQAKPALSEHPAIAQEVDIRAAGRLQRYLEDVATHFGKSDERNVSKIATSKKRLSAMVESPIAARRMEAYMTAKPIGQTAFANQVGTTDRTLRSFRATGRIRRDIFFNIAKAMGLKVDELVKPE